MGLQLGDTIEGKYRIVRLLGEGGMGSVYEGENVRIHRKVAIKVLHAAVAAKADVVQRFEREAQAAGRIGSQHIVEVLDLGNLSEGERFMVMEYLEGESLGDRIKRQKRLTPHEVATVLVQLLEGLEAAHVAGIIHRDLKPDNVFLVANRGGQRDFVKVLDFGVSKFSALDTEMSMTKTGAVMGTPFYMSPEQARGQKVDPRSDIYSAGVVAYQAVTGRVPFHAETFNELVFKIALEAPEPAELVAPGLDPGFAALIARSMLRDPAGRFQSAREFQAAVSAWAQGASGTNLDRASALPPGAGGTPPNPFAATPTSIGLSTTVDPNAPPKGAELGVSQGGGAVAAAPPRSSAMIVAIGLASVLAVCGGAFGAYRILGSPSGPPAAATGIPIATTATATPSATAAASATATAAEPAPSVAVTATAAVSAEATAPTAPAPLKGKLSGKLPGKGPAAPAPASTGRAGGRSIDGTL
jgi:serine/threonine-protein kinase